MSACVGCSVGGGDKDCCPPWGEEEVGGLCVGGSLDAKELSLN